MTNPGGTCCKLLLKVRDELEEEIEEAIASLVDAK